MRRARRALAGPTIAIAVALAGCGGDAPSGLPAGPATTGPSAGGPSPSAAEPSAAATASAPIPGVAVDPSLLERLPEAVEGVEVRADPETAAEIARDTDLARDVSDIAVAVAFGPVATDDAGDYAVVAMARLRPGVFDEAWFRDWRDTYDAEVCAQAGGVDTGRSEIPIGGLTVHRSTCAGGVVIHHAYLADGEVVVSIQGAGDLDLGRRIVEGLTE